jgi:predicted esterase
MRPLLLTVVTTMAFPLGSPAQESRFELGQRLRLFERALDKYTSPEARKRALAPLEKATPTFFSGQLGNAAGLLDRARLLLADKAVSDDSLWAESLVVKPSKRLLDTGARELGVKVESLYKVEAKRPENVRLRLSLLRNGEKPAAAVTADLAAVPFRTTFPLKKVREGDYQLRSEILTGGAVRASGEQTVSVVHDLPNRLATLKKGIDALEGKPRTHEAATLGRLYSILCELDAGRTPETNYPAARLLTEAEALLVGKPYYGPARPGQFWLSLVTGPATDTVRMQIPGAAKAGKPLPLVVAMHGAGGSENMFFDGYGDGLVAKLCAKRGWLLVTTRTPLLAFGGGPDVPRVIDALAKVYPVDTKKVFLVGHSMGAAQAVATAGRHPGRFAGVAALGGGGGFKATEEIKSVPIYVGCGERDFALNGSRNLHKALVKGGVKKAVFKAYPDVEHLTIVQLALPDVFRFFDEAAGR